MYLNITPVTDFNNFLFIKRSQVKIIVAILFINDKHD
jgi:hypothetical protein